MKEIKEPLFILSIYESKTNYDAFIISFNNKGKKILLRAKGFQKEESKNRLKFEPFTFIQTEYFDNWGKYKLLKRGDQILKINKTKKTIFFQEIIKELLLREEEVNEKLIKLIFYIFNKINNNLEIDNEILFFLILFLKNKNIYFQFNKCVNCGSEKNIEYFLMHRGGVLCNKCYINEKNRLSYDQLEKIKFLFNIKNLHDLDNLNLDPKEEKNIKLMIKDYFETELGYFLYNLDNI